MIYLLVNRSITVLQSEKHRVPRPTDVDTQLQRLSDALRNSPCIRFLGRGANANALVNGASESNAAMRGRLTRVLRRLPTIHIRP